MVISVVKYQRCEMEKGWENLYISIVYTYLCIIVCTYMWINRMRGQNLRRSLIFFHVLFSYSTKRSLECTNIVHSLLVFCIIREVVLSFFAYGHCFLGNNICVCMSISKLPYLACFILENWRIRYLYLEHTK